MRNTSLFSSFLRGQGWLKLVELPISLHLRLAPPQGSHYWMVNLRCKCGSCPICSSFLKEPSPQEPVLSVACSVSHDRTARVRARVHQSRFVSLVISSGLVWRGIELPFWFPHGTALYLLINGCVRWERKAPKCYVQTQ